MSNWIRWESNRGAQNAACFPKLFLESQLHGGLLRPGEKRGFQKIVRDQRCVQSSLTMLQALSRSRMANLELSTRYEIVSNHRGNITCMSLDPVEGRFLLTAGGDGVISCMDLSSFDAQGTKQGGVVRAPTIRQGSVGAKRSFVSGLQWYPQDSGCFVSSDYSGQVHIWDSNVFEIAFTFDLSNIASTSVNNTPSETFGKLFNNGYNTHGYTGHSASHTNFTGRNDFHRTDFRENSQSTNKVICARMQLNESSRMLIGCGLSDSSIKLCDTRTGDSCLTIRGHSQSLSCLQWNPKNMNHLTSGSFDGTVKTWDIRHVGGVSFNNYGNETHQPLLSLDWRGDHTTVASAYTASNSHTSHSSNSNAADVHFYNKRIKIDHDSLALSKAYDGSVMSLQYTSCGNYLVTAGTNSNNSGISTPAANHTIRLWGASTGNLKSVNYETSSHSSASNNQSKNIGNNTKIPYEMTIAKFTCGGDDLLLYPCGDSGDIAIVPIHSSKGRPLRVLKGHLSNVNSIIYRGNEYDQCISAGRDGMIYVWECKSTSSDASKFSAVPQSLDLDLDGQDLHDQIESLRREGKLAGSHIGGGTRPSQENDDAWSDQEENR